jgi:hypothetical protein
MSDEELSAPAEVVEAPALPEPELVVEPTPEGAPWHDPEPQADPPSPPAMQSEPEPVTEPATEPVQTTPLAGDVTPPGPSPAPITTFLRVTYNPPSSVDLPFVLEGTGYAFFAGTFFVLCQADAEAYRTLPHFTLTDAAAPTPTAR